jgi:hypothetical protein
MTHLLFLLKFLSIQKTIINTQKKFCHVIGSFKRGGVEKLPTWQENGPQKPA